MVHNSRRPLDRLNTHYYRMESKRTATLEQHGCWAWLFQYPPSSIANSSSYSSNAFTFCDPVRRHRLSTVDRVCTQVDVVKSRDHVDLSNYVTNGEWSFVGTRIVRNEVRYPIGPAVYPDVTVYVTMRRRILYYMLNIILPCISLNVLSLLAFCLPPDAGEKITLGITVLLSYSVFMLLVAENMPPTSEFVPLIGKHRLYTESACRSHKVFSS